jgi:hypothetical protein
VYFTTNEKIKNRISIKRKTHNDELIGFTELEGWVLSKKILIEVFHILIALGIVLAYLYAISLFKPEYVILSRGVVWSRVYSIDSTYETLILLAVALTISVCVYAIGGFGAVKLTKVSMYVLAILIIVCGLPLAYWIAYIWSPQISQDHSFIRLSELDAGIFHVYAPVYPLLLLTMLYAWLLPIIAKVLKRHVRLKVRYSRTVSASGSYDPPGNILMERLGLTFALFLSIALPLIPYLSSINPTFKPASVDIWGYAMFLDGMLVRDPLSALECVFYSGLWGRMLYLLMLYGLVSIGIPREVVLNFEALLIAPLLTLAVYFSAKRLSGESSYAVLASLAAVLGFNMTANMFGGFFANWVALTLFYACIGLTPSLVMGDVKSLVLCIIASTAMFYMHTWTWGIIMATLTAYLALSTLESLRSGKPTVNKHLLTLLIVNAAVDLLKNSLTPGRSGLTASATTLSRYSGFENLLNLAWNLNRLTRTYLGGLLFNPLHMLLALIGILSMFKRGGEYSKLILAWVAVASTPFLFANVALQSRLLLVMPLPILIAEGLWALSRLLARFDSKLPKLLQAFFITSSLTYTVRALCNLI